MQPCIAACIAAMHVVQSTLHVKGAWDSAAVHLQGQARCELGELTAYQLALAGAQLAIALQHAVDSLLETVLDVM